MNMKQSNNPVWQRQLKFNAVLINLEKENLELMKDSRIFLSKKEYLSTIQHIKKTITSLESQQRAFKGFLKGKNKWGEQRCRQWIFNQFVWTGENDVSFQWYKTSVIFQHSFLQYFFLNGKKGTVPLNSSLHKFAEAWQLAVPPQRTDVGV
jgi:hypothetical protein